ncbi:hypothetical protein E2C01_049802 [Portunus trituberculatus]|uniref:Uncharacterized protein n=1 Tax=Portunus trituberculatus TaxID=210409 RepID=A0A5B7GES7_PORTR|nr:hypothetical protein [Portunus trituberculatus]
METGHYEPLEPCTIQLVVHYLLQMNNNAAIGPGMCGVRQAQLGRQVHKDICVRSSAIATVVKVVDMITGKSSLLLSPWRTANLTTIEKMMSHSQDLQPFIKIKLNAMSMEGGDALPHVMDRRALRNAVLV